MDTNSGYMNKEKMQRINNWKTAIGLQAVDGLQPSDYLYELAGKHIEGELSIQEVQKFLKSYYNEKNRRETDENANEADKVSANITELLDDRRFSLCPDEYRSIHESIFYNVFSHAGMYRIRNISKREWILQKDSVDYGDCHTITEDLEKEMKKESKFDYSELDEKEKIHHFADFISKIWQIHPFFEGNTRTTALFAVKYLRSMGMNIDNGVFQNHSMYFRNALVRACYSNSRIGVDKDSSFLYKFFYNLLEGEKNELKNRDMLILAPEDWNKEKKNENVNELSKTIVIKKKVTDIEIYKHNG